MPRKSTPAQIEASRRNGALSRGPRTAAGRARSARNHTLHGLTGQNVLLPGEDPAAFEQTLAAFRELYQPGNPMETECVAEMAALAWRIQRSRNRELASSAAGPTEIMASLRVIGCEHALDGKLRRQVRRFFELRALRLVQLSGSLQEMQTSNPA